MPQLMPFYWMFSLIVIFLLLLCMWLIYDFLNLKNHNMCNIMFNFNHNWMW